ncbi:hypothetical protein OOZ63_09320 [Paucibacter sp. PLA-PC-4]|uniref:hypothetical protein n=1 Tax=Paucibacter sp. PLA-PC-4 TaxID=2993655 RepID=UPI0022489F3E|nr:hypothetical protein [Paucibacter sp. PLA-PC-4]MCX2862039.1 hypothetical protein [Paucibacter sp. PLA-PC-4]
MPSSTDAVLRKTDAARRLLAGPRQALPAGLRMLLIMVDGRRSLGELQTLAQGLGLAPHQAVERLLAQGLVSGAVSEPAAAPAGAAAAARLMRAKFFALDLAARMLAGRDAALREAARTVDSESRFVAWMDHCAAEIALAADAERAALFRERVGAVR